MQLSIFGRGHSPFAVPPFADYALARMIQGHGRQIAELQRLVETNSLPSALCLEGPLGIGKATLARAFVAQTLGLSPTQEREPLTDHPDIWHFSPTADRPRLKIAEVREALLPFVRQAPFTGDRAFVVLEDADTYLGIDQPGLANILLKSLEEPRAGVHFLLTSSCPERLIDTVRSRTHSIAFGALPADKLDALARANGWPQWSIALASGSPGIALQLCKHGDAMIPMVSTALAVLLGQLPSLSLGEQAASLEADVWLGVCHFGARIALAWSHATFPHSRAVAEALNVGASDLITLHDALLERGGNAACRDLADTWLRWEALADTTINRRLRLAADIEALRFAHLN